MRLKKFRNFDASALGGFAKKNIFVGLNAQGKTNLLEAIYCLATMRSFRTARTAEMIQLGQEGFFINGSVMSSNMRRDISIYYSLKKKRYPLTATR